LNISDLLFDKSNSNAISEFADNFGVNESQAKDAISSLAKSLTRGLGENTQDVKGLDSLMDALERGKHSRYLEGEEHHVKNRQASLRNYLIVIKTVQW